MRGRCDRADRGDEGWEGGVKVTGEGTCGCLLAVLEEVRGRDGWDGEKEEGGSVVFGGRTCEWEGESSKRGGREREKGDFKFASPQRIGECTVLYLHTPLFLKPHTHLSLVRHHQHSLPLTSHSFNNPPMRTRWTGGGWYGSAAGRGEAGREAVRL